MGPKDIDRSRNNTIGQFFRVTPISELRLVIFVKLLPECRTMLDMRAQFTVFRALEFVEAFEFFGQGIEIEFIAK